MACLFCKIIAGDIPSSGVYSDERIVAFGDVNPQAPLHVLLVPRKHLATLNDLTADDAELAGDLILRASALAKAHGYEERGYRLVFNCNADAGQSVSHVHLHLMAGRQMTWPPG